MFNSTLNTTSFVQTKDRSTVQQGPVIRMAKVLLTSHLINTQEMLV